MTTDELPILLVEDNPDDVYLIQRALKSARLANSVRVLHEAEAAMAYLSQAQADTRADEPLPILVLLDLKLGQMSGIERLRWARQQDHLKQLRIIVLTSSLEHADIDRAYELGANAYLMKPVEHDDLLDLVKTLNLSWIITEPSQEASA